jgi:hypothetical protein
MRTNLALQIMREVAADRRDSAERFFSDRELDGAGQDSLDAKAKRLFDAKLLGREPDADLIEWRRV